MHKGAVRRDVSDSAIFRHPLAYWLWCLKFCIYIAIAWLRYGKNQTLTFVSGISYLTKEVCVSCQD
jgi:hypothetical protein